MSLTPLQRAKYLLKLSLAVAMHASGAWLLWRRFFVRSRVPVLMYHRVLPRDVAAQSWSHPSIVVTPETFERHMQLLRRWFRVLTLQEFVERVQAGQPFEPGSCLVTFDDGWEDTYTEAWPLLKRHAVPAVVFLPVWYIGSEDTFWQERLGGLVFEVWRRAQSDEVFAATARETLARFGLDVTPTGDEAQARAAIRDLVRSRKKATAGLSADAIAALSGLLGRPGDVGVDRFMTWDQVRAMAEDGVTFGGHGVTHRMLTTLAPEDVHMEVHGSRYEIGRRIDTDVTAFCYPNGDWNAEVTQTVQGAGFTVAFSTAPGLADVSSNRFAIERVNMHEDMTRHPSMFLARVMGAL